MLILKASALQMRMDRVKLKKAVPLKGGRELFSEKSSEGVLNPSYYNKPYYARKTPPSSKTVVFESTSPLRAGTF